MVNQMATFAVKALLRAVPVAALVVLELPLLIGCAPGVARPGVPWPTTAATVGGVVNGRERAAATKRTPTSVPFVSFNVPNLHYIEDDWRFTSMARYRLPNEYEIHDALQSVALMGGSVVRFYTVFVR